MKSIRLKLVVFFTALILSSSLAIGLLAIRIAGDAITREAETGLLNMATEGAAFTEARVQTQLQTLKVLAGLTDITGMDWEAQREQLSSQLDKTGFLAMAVVTPDGTARYNDGSTAQLGDRDYVQKALSGEANVSDLIVSSVTGEIVLMYAHPIEDRGRVVGALLGRREGTALSNITNTIGYGENGYAYMINDQGTMVAHPDSSRVMDQFNPIVLSTEDPSLAPLAQVFERIIREHSGVDDYTFNGLDVYAGYAPVRGTNWYLAVTADQSEVLGEVGNMTRAVFSVLIGALILSALATFLIGTSIARPLVRISDLADRIADLDIRENVDPKLLGIQDETGKMARSLQSITEGLRRAIGEVGKASEQVAASSEELTATSEQSSSSAQEVSRTVEEIARGASDQARNTETGSARAMLLGELMEKNQTSLEKMNDATDEVIVVVNEGLEVIGELARVSEESGGQTRNVQEGINSTNESAKRIGEASSVIASIADQTNLLALNAAIEAARAGEAGRGFAVVADEIRKLAEQSTESTKKIDDIVRELQNNSERSVEIMGQVSGVLNVQLQKVTDSREKYLQISEAIRKSEEAVRELNSSAGEMNQMKGEILDTLQNLAAIAEENSASTQEVSAAMEEQTAQNLQGIVARFRI